MKSPFQNIQPANPGNPPPNPFSNIQGIFNSQLGQMGIEYTKQVVQQNRMSSFIFNPDIRYFFDVDINYVSKKLLIGEWRKTEPEFHPKYQGFLPPKYEVHSPDLYIPAMSLMTFVLITCLSSGIGDKFQPELIGSTMGTCVFLIILELLISKMILFGLQVKNVGFLELLSHISYKFFTLCIMRIFDLFIKWTLFYYLLEIYVCSMGVLFLYKTLQRYIFSSVSEQIGIDNYLKNGILIVSAVQFPFTFLMIFMTVH